MEKKHIFDKPENVKRFLFIFFSIVVVLLIVDVGYIYLSKKHIIDNHAYYKWEEWWGFYAFFGFVSCVVLVLISKYILRPLVMRKEDYYE